VKVDSDMTKASMIVSHWCDAAVLAFGMFAAHWQQTVAVAAAMRQRL